MSLFGVVVILVVYRHMNFSRSRRDKWFFWNYNIISDVMSIFDASTCGVVELRNVV